MRDPDTPWRERRDLAHTRTTLLPPRDRVRCRSPSRPGQIGLLPASTSSVMATLTRLYANIHLPVPFGFVAAARLLAPDRYPRIRTRRSGRLVRARGDEVIGLFPLAPPHWLETRAQPGAAVGCPTSRKYAHWRLTQHGGRRGEPALRLRGLRRSDGDLAFFSQAPQDWPGSRRSRTRCRSSSVRHRRSLGTTTSSTASSWRADVRVRGVAVSRRAWPRAACACAGHLQTGGIASIALDTSRGDSSRLISRSSGSWDNLVDAPVLAQDWGGRAHTRLRRRVFPHRDCLQGGEPTPPASTPCLPPPLTSATRWMHRALPHPNAAQNADTSVSQAVRLCRVTSGLDIEAQHRVEDDPAPLLPGPEEDMVSVADA